AGVNGACATEVLSGHREICSHYLRSTVCVWRPGSKCALVSAIFVGRLATLHLRHFSTVSGGSAGRERFLHSKLHIPARLAIHSSALARLFSQSSFSASRFTAEQLTNWPNCPMSALGQKQTSGKGRQMSALPPKADIAECDWHVRFVPKADSCIAANSG